MGSFSTRLSKSWLVQYSGSLKVVSNDLNQEPGDTLLFPNMSFQMMGGVQGWNLTDVTIMLEVGAHISPKTRDEGESYINAGNRNGKNSGNNS